MKLLHFFQIVRNRLGLGSASLRQFLVALAAVLIVIAIFALPVHAAITHNGIICDGGESNCVESWYGGSIRVYSDAGATQKFSVVGSSGDTSIVGDATIGGSADITGDLTVTGVITADGGYVSITPVPTATIVPAATPNSNMKCAHGTQNVIGVATVAAPTLTAAGISTPIAVTHALGADPAGDYNLVTHTNAAGVVTLKVWGLVAQTPVAATTVVAVDYSVCGN